MFLAFLLSKQVLMQTASQAVGASAGLGRDATRSARHGSHLTKRACVAHRSTGARDPAEMCDRHSQCTGMLRAPLGLPLQSRRSKKKIISDFENGDHRASKQRPLLSTGPCDGTAHTQGACPVMPLPSAFALPRNQRSPCSAILSQCP